ncbi:MAG TPA: tetratricopeptide repeat protein [Leptolyngbyaceae cyanobacterium]
MAQKRKPRSVQATEAGLKILKEFKAANRDSEGQRLTLQRIADKAGVDPKTFKTFFYGGGVDPESASAICEKAFGLKVTDIVGVEAWNQVTSKPKSQNPEYSGVVDNPALGTQTTLKHHNNTPNSGAVEFVGRSKQLSELHQLLEQNNQVVIAAIAGMGGVGKTELAIQYAKEHKDTYKGGICWLYPKRGDIGGQIVEFAITHFQNLILPKGLTLAGQVEFCWQHWAEGQVLIVIDDVVDYKQIKPYLPSESRFKVLFTTREKFPKPLVRLDLDVLKPRGAFDLLKSLVGRDRLKREPWVARKLCKWLGYLPLGLELVGHYLAQDENLSLAEMLRRLERKRLRHHALENPEPTMTAQLGVADAFELSWERLDETAQRLGCHLSLYALAPIPWKPNELQIVVSEEDEKVIKEALEAQGITPEILEELANSIEATEEAKNKLVRMNLLQPCGYGTYRLHQLIREFLREKLETLPDAEELKCYFVKFMVEIAKHIPSPPNHNDRLTITSLIPHFEEVIEEMTNYLANSDFGYLFTLVISFYENQCLYLFAEQWCYKLRKKGQDRFQGDNLFVAFVQKRLALILRLQGRYSESETIYKMLIEFFKTRSDDRHIYLLVTQYELALVYIQQDRFDEAEATLKKCLNDVNQTNIYSYLDNEFNDLVEVYQNQEYLNYAGNLSIKDSSYTKDAKDKEPHILISVLNSLGNLYQEQGRYPEAELLLKKSLDFAKNLLGENHVSIAVYQNNLAHLYKLQGKYEEAKYLFAQSLDILKSFWGENHPQLAYILSNLGNLYSLQGIPDQAESFFKQALQMRKNFLGENHLDYAASLNDLGLLYTELGRYKAAKPLLLKSLEIKENLIGKRHLDYAISLNNLGMLYFFQQQLAKAEPLYLESLQIRIEILGEEHPDVASTLHNLAELYSYQERFDEAEAFWKKALDIAFRTLGDNHPDTVLYQQMLQFLPLIRTIPIELKQKMMSEYLDIFNKHPMLKKLSKARRKAQGFGKQPGVSIIKGIQSKDILQSPNFTNYLVPIAQRIFSQLSNHIKKQATEGYQKLGKGIVLIEVQSSYDELRISYREQEDCVKASQNAPSEMWNSVLMYLDMYNPEDNFIVLIVDPLENPGTNTCHHYMLPF